MGFNPRWTIGRIYSSEYLENNNNPFAVIVLAHRETQQTRNDNQSKYREKLRLAKSLYSKGYEKRDIVELYRLIDWMMTLPKGLQRNFSTEIYAFEEEQQMPYITSGERIARQDGRVENCRENIIDLLQIRFESVPEETIQQITQINDLARLKFLFRQVATSSSLADFQQLLNQ
ncbi:hypothetical protein PN462_05280 [Spirulina sp. CS-785/01]|uniref:hypothetical protein n=1 Tax=Spirulina sp. CS-785/01 TaxID=3021716 RepID=UPI002330B0FA|nr:hypothetical protein [Spirulina sp. CS-785/01]MDB9312509.1 hypothetical protein [Spirulina sp. CS-785/01]